MRVTSIGATCNISWAPGTFASSGVMTMTLGYSPVGITAADGARIKTAVWIQYGGPALLKPVHLTFTSPTGSTNPHIYHIYSTVGGTQTQAQTASRNGDKVSTEISHFSVYGVGGDPAPPVAARAGRGGHRRDRAALEARASGDVGLTETASYVTAAFAVGACLAAADRRRHCDGGLRPSIEQAHRAGAASYTDPNAPERCSCATRWANGGTVAD